MLGRKEFYDDMVEKAIAPIKIRYDRVMKLIDKANIFCDMLVKYTGDDTWQIQTTEGIENIESTDKLIEYLEYEIKEMAFNLFMEGTLVFAE